MPGSGSFWKVGLIPQAVANGLSTILVLLFLLSSLHGSLLDVGVLAGVGALALIPSQMVWGRLVDEAGRCKPFLILGFVGMGASLAAIPLAGSISMLFVLVCLKSTLYAATIPSRQLLTVETEEKDGWQRGLANMAFLTTMGETAGMGLGALVVATLSFSELFFICGILCLASAAVLGVIATEPGIMIQRRLVALDRTTSTLVAVSDYVGAPRNSGLRESYGNAVAMLNRSTKFLLVGIFSFALAGTAFYTPLTAYLAGFYPSSSVFLVFFGGSLAGGLAYLVVGRTAPSPARSLTLSATTRMVVIPLLLLAAIGASPGLALAALVLAILEVVWSFFDVSSTFAYLETAKMGRAGFYGGLVGLGSASGGFLGGFVSMQFGFTSLFGLCSALCAGALGAFIMQFRRSS